MKKNLFLSLAFMLISALCFSKNNVMAKDSNGYETNAGVVKTPEQKQARLAEIRSRIEEIRNMDKSQLSKAERRELRTELKALRKENRALDSTTTGTNIIYFVFIGLVLGGLAYELAKS